MICCFRAYAPTLRCLCIMCCSHKCVTIYNTLIQLSIYTLAIVVMGPVLKCDLLATSKKGRFLIFIKRNIR